MGFKCTILGHNFEKREAERDKEQGDDSVIVEVTKKVCKRCDKERHERRSTKVREGESTETDNTDTRGTKGTTDTTGTNTTKTGNTTDSNPEYSSGYSTPEGYESQANAGIVIKDNSNTEPASENTRTDDENAESKNDNTVIEDNRTHNSYKKVQGEDAYISSSTDHSTSVVSCEECEYEKQYERQVSRESGDICHKCGGWISVDSMEV